MLHKLTQSSDQNKVVHVHSVNSFKCWSYRHWNVMRPQELKLFVMVFSHILCDRNMLWSGCFFKLREARSLFMHLDGCPLPPLPIEMWLAWVACLKARYGTVVLQLIWGGNCCSEGLGLFTHPPPCDLDAGRKQMDGRRVSYLAACVHCNPVSWADCCGQLNYWSGFSVHNMLALNY